MSKAGSSTVRRLPDIGLERCERLRDRLCRPDGVRADAGGDDEGLAVVNLERRKSSGRAFYYGAIALDEIEHVHGAVCVMRNGLGEPVTPGFDELEAMETSFLFAPSRAGSQ